MLKKISFRLLYVACAAIALTAWYLGSAAMILR